MGPGFTLRIRLQQLHQRQHVVRGMYMLGLVLALVIDSTWVTRDIVNRDGGQVTSSGCGIASCMSRRSRCSIAVKTLTCVYVLPIGDDTAF